MRPTRWRTKFERSASSLVLYILLVFSSQAYALGDAEPKWFIDWGGKTISMLDSNPGLLGFKVGTIAGDIGIGAAIFVLPKTVNQNTATGYRRITTYSSGGLHVEYHTRLVDWLYIVPNLYAAMAFGEISNRDLDVIRTNSTTAILLEPTLNLRIRMFRQNYLNIGGGYTLIQRSELANSNPTFNIYYRVEW